MRTWGWVALAALVLLVLFALQNSQVVEVRFLFWPALVSQAVLSFVAFGVGIIVGAVLSLVLRAPRRS